MACVFERDIKALTTFCLFASLSPGGEQVAHHVPHHEVPRATGPLDDNQNLETKEIPPFSLCKYFCYRSLKVTSRMCPARILSCVFRDPKGLEHHRDMGPWGERSLSQEQPEGTAIRAQLSPSNVSLFQLIFTMCNIFGKNLFGEMF